MSFFFDGFLVSDRRIAMLLARVDRSGECWRWLGRHDAKDGYAVASVGNQPKRLHRVFLVWAGVTIPPGHLVLHRCDNPGCVRPDHLFTGTQADNMRDMSRKGRSLRGDRNPMRRYPEKCPRGEQHGCAKLTTERVRAMRARRAEGRTYSQLALEFQTPRSTVAAVCTGRLWRGVL